MTWEPGRERIQHLIDKGEIGVVSPDIKAAARMLEDAGRHLATAATAKSSGEPWSSPGSPDGTTIAIMADFDPRIPSIARVYDYLLNGKDNFAADREVAERLIAAAPLTVQVTRENRQFLARAVTWAANQGVGQFIDLGCGMPTVPNTHETAQAIIPDARVAYLDNDPVVLTHLRALAEHGNPGVTVLDGDVREPAAIIAAVEYDIDLKTPACLLMGYLLHFFAPDAARDLVATYVARLAPGSYVVLSVGRADGEAAKQGFSAYSASGTRVYNHSVAEFASFFGSLELVPPGVVDAREWYPDAAEPVHAPPRDGQVIVGVARV